MLVILYYEFGIYRYYIRTKMCVALRFHTVTADIKAKLSNLTVHDS